MILPKDGLRVLNFITGWLTSIGRSVFFWFLVSACLCIITIVVDVMGIARDWHSEIAEAESLLTNVVASFFLYYLVVHLPSERRRVLMRKNAKNLYLYVKKQILYDIISGSWLGGRRDIDNSVEGMALLMTPEGFRQCFGHGHESDEGIYAFRNHIQSCEKDFRSVVFKFKLIARQIEFILNNFEQLDPKQFQTLKWTEHQLSELDDLHADYNDEKRLDQLIWTIFGGWSMIDGFRGYDPIEKAIDEI